MTIERGCPTADAVSHSPTLDSANANGCIAGASEHTACDKRVPLIVTALESTDFPTPRLLDSLTPDSPTSRSSTPDSRSSTPDSTRDYDAPSQLQRFADASMRMNSSRRGRAGAVA